MTNVLCVLIHLKGTIVLSPVTHVTSGVISSVERLNLARTRNYNLSTIFLGIVLPVQCYL